MQDYLQRRVELKVEVRNNLFCELERTGIELREGTSGIVENCSVIECQGFGLSSLRSDIMFIH